MYGLPADFDGRIFVGRTLEVVSFFVNQMILRFDQDISVRLEGEYSLQLDSGSEPEIIEVPEFHPELTKLLEQTVSNASSAKDGTLKIQFSGGAIFTCYDRTPGYESYEIDIGDRRIIV
ncbi:MAG TPA: DUF6188 family protein [Micropepsaceae bacterium]|nr:DUF6188 family protein [Micropepsaceae bacterium]